MLLYLSVINYHYKHNGAVRLFSKMILRFSMDGQYYL